MRASYIAALCMGLEGQINSILIEHFFEAVGSRYKNIIKPLLMLNVRDRFSTSKSASRSPSLVLTAVCPVRAAAKAHGDPWPAAPVRV